MMTRVTPYATNPIIARALYYVQYIEEIGSGTTDIFEHCAAQGLEPPVFEVDVRHVSVTVMRPTFDEKGHQVGQKTAEVGQKPDFSALMSVGRKDFRMKCERVWECLARDPRMSRHLISQALGIAESTVQCATNALQEVGLLYREGRGKGVRWIVLLPSQKFITKRSEAITKCAEPATKSCKAITIKRIAKRKGGRK